MLISPIPSKLRQEMEADPFYGQCCISGLKKTHWVKIDWHHNFTTFMFGNKGRLNEAWCILPLHPSIHSKAGTKSVKEKLDWIMYNRADEDTLRKYSKAVDLIRERDRLNSKFGVWQPKI